MSSNAAMLLNRLVPGRASARYGKQVLCLLASLHVVALMMLVATESDLVAKAAFLLVWAALNCLWLALIRRPTVAALISLEFVIALTLLSRFKYDKLWMTLDFVDVMIVDRDTSAFLLAAFPSLRGWIALAAAGTGALLIVIWRIDEYRVRVSSALLGGSFSMIALIVLSLSFPTELHEDFVSQDYVSKFARTGVEAIHEFASHGYLDSEAGLAESLKTTSAARHPSRRLPNIILLHDESSFDVTAAPGIKVPEGYHNHFRSMDGKARKLLVEGIGGPSWFAEYNVLTGLSVRSYGRFATSVTRIAAGRVGRGLPRSLSHCGYRSFSLYPFYGSFLGSRAFQTSVGVENYMDMVALGTRDFEADSFYFDQAIKIIERERGSAPLFLYVYTVANHFPWDKRLRPELTPNWRDLGNGPEVDEYIRRQTMTAHDYRRLLDRLAQRFPTEPFLIVRYGDHQPQFGARIIDPSLSSRAFAQHLEQSDPRYLTTYYAIDAVNFTPVDLSSALDTLDAPYLPLVIEDAAGVPLDPSFSEQRNILQRCNGLFYSCAHGAEARRFNRLLIQAGAIKGF
ncbi:sulfatase-like hydrolase/transferase [Bradyrhizobium sp.]|uniref:sulfatase-like hydrolase/transferase n=1 Tax=Bradyrhizobium sp. TaxID=376 RepID=UPI002B48B08E|nr:sulfatase-like hydrolase/transferase [Bradyrhizobium sp.]